MPSSFYTVEQHSQQDTHIQAAIRFNPDHSIFAGHFPDQPVVPGVCMIQIVKNLMEQFLGNKNLFLSHGHQVKFLQLIIPDRKDLIQVEVAIEERPGEYPVQATFKKDGQALLKMTGIFTLLHI